MDLALVHQRMCEGVLGQGGGGNYFASAVAALKLLVDDLAQKRVLATNALGFLSGAIGRGD
jgi:hypothetical protein